MLPIVISHGGLNDSRYLSRGETIRLGRQSRPQLRSLLAADDERSPAGTEAEQGGKIHLVISQAIMPRRRGPADAVAAGLLLFNANVSARRTPRRSPAPIAHHHPICAKLSMIEWHEIENSVFSAPPFPFPPAAFFFFLLLFLSSSSRPPPKSGRDFPLYQFNHLHCEEYSRISPILRGHTWYLEFIEQNNFDMFVYFCLLFFFSFFSSFFELKKQWRFFSLSV